MNIFFDKALKSKFLDAQGLTSDPEGYVVYLKNKQRVKDEDNNPIKTKDFGGFRKGSVIFLNKDIDTVIKEATIDSK